MSASGERSVGTGYLARVEGEGGLRVRIRDGAVTDVELRIFEPPRFFEALLRGRAYDEPPDITARVCGICPVAYQLAACAAIEDACGVRVPEPIRRLRRLLLCGEWIESHALHIFLLHAPDFLGYESGFAMARDHREVVERGLELKQTGNELVRLLGGREIHPINVRLGGFHRAPRRPELTPLVGRLERATQLALATVHFAAGLDSPERQLGCELVALTEPDGYAMERGRLTSDRGLDIAPHEWDDHFVEEQVPQSTALHSRLRDRGPYLVGPLARYSLGYETLTQEAREAARDAGLTPICRNPYRSIVVRAVEVLQASHEALRLIDAYEPPDAPAVPVEPRAGTGHGWAEAPRGTLYHRYRLADDGTILDARIVPPTSQNQRTIEADLRAFVAANVERPDAELALGCERLIRNHDPCISCATHFLDLSVDRR